MSAENRVKLERLIASTGWSDDKQKTWLKKIKRECWRDCTDHEIEKAIDMLTVYNGMFSSHCIDTTTNTTNNDEVDALRVYKDE